MAPTGPKILVVLSSHNKLGNTGKPTGWYLPELAHPYYKFQAANAQITIAPPAGGEAPLDPISISMFKDDGEAQKFLREEKKVWDATEKLSGLVGKAGDFDAM
ncbi:hypothetical protein LTR86_004953 [Recurvomyces mirabilis]|nr:hypothetical protein LTR86_004953 [Recurvomyces mirabilis]